MKPSSPLILRSAGPRARPFLCLARRATTGERAPFVVHGDIRFSRVVGRLHRIGSVDPDLGAGDIGNGGCPALLSGSAKAQVRQMVGNSRADLRIDFIVVSLPMWFVRVGVLYSYSPEESRSTSTVVIQVSLPVIARSGEKPDIRSRMALRPCSTESASRRSTVGERSTTGCYSMTSRDASRGGSGPHTSLQLLGRAPRSVRALE